MTRQRLAYLRSHRLDRLVRSAAAAFKRQLKTVSTPEELGAALQQTLAEACLQAREAARGDALKQAAEAWAKRDLGRLKYKMSSARLSERHALPLSARSEAAGFLEKRKALTPSAAQQVIRAYGNEAARVTRRLGAAVERKAQDLVIDLLEDDVHVEAGAAAFASLLMDHGLGNHAASLAETLLRTEVMLADSAGREAWDADPAVQEVLWGWEYSTAGDDRVRPTHAAMDGVQLAKDDPLWLVWTPPNGWQCRCIKLELFDRPSSPRRPPDYVNVDGINVKVYPDEGWAFHPLRALEGAA